MDTSGVDFVVYPCDLIQLSKSYSAITYCGLPYADAAIETEEQSVRFIIHDGGCQPCHLQGLLTYNTSTKTFFAPGKIYEALHSKTLIPCSSNTDALVFETAILASRYGFEPAQEAQHEASLLEQHMVPRMNSPSMNSSRTNSNQSRCQNVVPGKNNRALQASITRNPADTSTSPNLPLLYHQDLLRLMLTGAYPQKGFSFLKQSGFIARHWPELEAITKTSHSKDYHPEGDLWQHTMETFSHRKTRDFSLSLALLLHDIGKPRADAHAGNRFYAHAEIGSSIAERFLKRLGFSNTLIDKVTFLIRFHMLPYGLPSLPFSRVEEQLASPYFPELLELFRCDEFSTFKGPELYYEACARYKEWCRLSKNPYRTIDNRKISGRTMRR